jgi:hypothetical protein
MQCGGHVEPQVLPAPVKHAAARRNNGAEACQEPPDIRIPPRGRQAGTALALNPASARKRPAGDQCSEVAVLEGSVVTCCTPRALLLASGIL